MLFLRTLLSNFGVEKYMHSLIDIFFSLRLSLSTSTRCSFISLYRLSLSPKLRFVTFDSFENWFFFRLVCKRRFNSSGIRCCLFLFCFNLQLPKKKNKRTFGSRRDGYNQIEVNAKSQILFLSRLITATPFCFSPLLRRPLTSVRELLLRIKNLTYLFPRFYIPLSIFQIWCNIVVVN